jgi:hypothetical protein
LRAADNEHLTSAADCFAGIEVSRVAVGNPHLLPLYLQFFMKKI